MNGTAFLLGHDQVEALQQLRVLAARRPVDIRGLTARLKTGDGKAAHMRQMTEQTILLPFNYAVTFSIETGHPCGTARHMSMSSPAAGRVPRPEAVWMVAEKLGFSGSLGECATWPEQLQGHGLAINVVQPIVLSASEGRA